MGVNIYNLPIWKQVNFRILMAIYKASVSLNITSAESNKHGQHHNISEAAALLERLADTAMDLHVNTRNGEILRLLTFNLRIIKV